MERKWSRSCYEGNWEDFEDEDVCPGRWINTEGEITGMRKEKKKPCLMLKDNDQIGQAALERDFTSIEALKGSLFTS